MKKYELVLVLDPVMKASDRKEKVDEFESKIKDFVLDKDDIGLLDLKYGLSWKKDKNRAYFVSYCLQLDVDGIALIKKEMLYKDYILRNFLYSMTKTQEFFKFVDLQKKLEATIASWGTQKFGQRISFFANDDNVQYLIWKSIPILKKYVTRFADIKPRRYTKSSVSRQKKLRRCVIRARELWLLEYIR